MSTNILPLKAFPGFSAYGLVSPQIIEAATIFNAEGVDALSGIPESAVAWSDVGTRTTASLFQAKIPIKLTSLLGFEPFDGTRKYHEMNVSAVTVKSDPWSLALEWPMQINQSGIAVLEDAYGFSGVAGDIVSHGRALKADLMASLIMAGQTNAALGMTATALTLPQPGYASGLPLFSDGTTSGASQHFSNPLVASSTKFKNLYLGAGQITASGVFGQSLIDMTQVPHPTKANMTLGLQVTDVIGPTYMLLPFWQLAIQSLSLATATVSGTPVAGATTNIYSADAIKNAGAQAMLGASGMSPWRFWIAPQLDYHPYVLANPGKHFWLNVSQTKASGKWAEIAAPTKDFTPKITMLGDGTEEARKTLKIRMFGDLNAGCAAGLPHFAKLYTESVPA